MNIYEHILKKLYFFILIKQTNSLSYTIICLYVRDIKMCQLNKMIMNLIALRSFSRCIWLPASVPRSQFGLLAAQIEVSGRRQDAMICLLGGQQVGAGPSVLLFFNILTHLLFRTVSSIFTMTFAFLLIFLSVIMVLAFGFSCFCFDGFFFSN